MSKEFDPSANWIPAQLKKPVREALDAGWKPGKDRIKAGGWFLYSPKGSEKFYIPNTCKDPDTVAKKLRALISKAYLSEPNAFEPTMPPEAAALLQDWSESAIMSGAVIIPGPIPHIRCPVCDLEYEGWEAFANHQGECGEAAIAAAEKSSPEKERARVVALRTEGKTYSEIVEMVDLPQHEVAALVASLNGGLPPKKPKPVLPKGGGAVRPAEGVLQSATDSTESVHSGTISTKEEAPLATESTTPTPKPGTKQESEATPKPRKGGYKWTQVNGRGNPLHEIVYEAVRMNRRFNAETDSKYAKRLADYIEGEGLLGKLPNADPDVQAAYVLGQIKELLGLGQPQEPEEDPEVIKQLQVQVAEKDAEIANLTKKVGEYTDFFLAMSEMAPKEKDK